MSFASQLQKQLADLVNAVEDRSSQRRNTTQLSSIPSVRALMDKTRPQQSSSPKVARPRLELDSKPAVESSLASPMVSTTAELPVAAPAPKQLPELNVRVPRPSGFTKAAGMLSPLSEFVETEFIKSYEAPLPKRMSLGPGASVGKSRSNTALNTTLVEVKEAK